MPSEKVVGFSQKPKLKPKPTTIFKTNSIPLFIRKSKKSFFPKQLTVGFTLKKITSSDPHHDISKQPR